MSKYRVEVEKRVLASKVPLRPGLASMKLKAIWLFPVFVVHLCHFHCCYELWYFGVSLARLDWRVVVLVACGPFRVV